LNKTGSHVHFARTDHSGSGMMKGKSDCVTTIPGCTTALKKVGIDVAYC